MTWLGTTISTIRTPPTLPWGKTSVYFVFPLPWEMFYISLNSEICKLWTCFFLCKIYIINTWVNEEDEGKKPLHLLFCTHNCHPLLHPWHSCLLGVHRSFSETGRASVIPVPAPKSHPRSPLAQGLGRISPSINHHCCCNISLLHQIMANAELMMLIPVLQMFST